MTYLNQTIFTAMAMTALLVAVGPPPAVAQGQPEFQSRDRGEPTSNEPEFTAATSSSIPFTMPDLRNRVGLRMSGELGIWENTRIGETVPHNSVVVSGHARIHRGLIIRGQMPYFHGGESGGSGGVGNPTLGLDYMVIDHESFKLALGFTHALGWAVREEGYGHRNAHVRNLELFSRDYANTWIHADMAFHRGRLFGQAQVAGGDWLDGRAWRFSGLFGWSMSKNMAFITEMTTLPIERGTSVKELTGFGHLDFGFRVARGRLSYGFRLGMALGGAMDDGDHNFGLGGDVGLVL